MTQILIKVIGNYQYQTAHCLGQGVYGKVYQGIERETKEKVAIKKIDLISLANDKYLQNAIFSEIYLLKRFDHPNIVKFRDVLSSKNSLYIITQFCKGGDLRDQIRKRRFTEEEVTEALVQIVMGFKELVQKKVVHRDLKPANILIHEGVYKIADFGFAKYVDNFGNQMLKSCVGSPIYMAPQLLQREPYTTKCDIWSLGIIAYQMLYGLSPWRAKDENQLLHGLKTIPITSILKNNSKYMSNKMFDFIAKCLAYHEKDRLSWSEVFNIFLPPDLLQQPTLSNQYSSSSTSSPSKSNVRMYNPKLRTTQPLEINSVEQTNNLHLKNNTFSYEKEKEKQKEKQQKIGIRRQERERSRSPNINFMQYRQEKLQKPSFNQAYTPRQHNSSLSQLAPSYTPRESSNMYIPINNLQIPTSPMSAPAMVISPRPQLASESPRKSYLQTQLKKQLSAPSDHKKEEKLYNECQYRYFCCTQLFVAFQQLQNTSFTPYAYMRLLYILIHLIKKQNNYVRSELLVAPYNKLTQQLLIKIEIEQKLTEMLQKDIVLLMETYNYFERMQNEVRSEMSYFLSEVMNQEKLDRISQVLYQSIKENVLIFMNLKDKLKYGNSERVAVVIQVLWNLMDLMIMHRNKSNPLTDVSQRGDQDRSDIVTLELKIERLLV